MYREIIKQREWGRHKNIYHIGILIIISLCLVKEYIFY